MERTQWKVGWMTSPSRTGFTLPCGPLVIVLAAAALEKTQRLGEFEATLLDSHLVPVGLVPIAAAGIIGLELLIAASVCVTALRVTALHTAATLFSLFTAYSVWRWMEGIRAPCHCFGPLFTMAPWQSLVLNLVLLALTASALIGANRPTCEVAAAASPFRSGTV